MSNRIEVGNLPAGTTIRTGVPAERPQEAIDALTKLFAEKDNVVSARLGLMEIVHADGRSEFTYTIGIQCSAGERDTIQEAIERLQASPIVAGRFPSFLLPANTSRKKLSSFFKKI